MQQSKPTTNHAEFPLTKPASHTPDERPVRPCYLRRVTRPGRHRGSPAFHRPSDQAMPSDQRRSEGQEGPRDLESGVLEGNETRRPGMLPR